jgi:helicase
MRAGGRDPEKIAARLNEKYGISAYVGDLYGYLDGVIRNLDAIEMMASAHSKPDIAKQAKDLKKSVEAGR